MPSTPGTVARKVTLSRADDARLKEVAAKNGESLSSLARHAIRSHLDRLDWITAAKAHAKSRAAIARATK